MLGAFWVTLLAHPMPTVDWPGARSSQLAFKWTPLEEVRTPLFRAFMKCVAAAQKSALPICASQGLGGADPSVPDGHTAPILQLYAVPPAAPFTHCGPVCGKSVSQPQGFGVVRTVPANEDLSGIGLSLGEDIPAVFPSFAVKLVLLIK